MNVSRHVVGLKGDDSMAVWVQGGFVGVRKQWLCSCSNGSVACDIGTQDEFGQDVPPLDLPELLENLIRESEPLLDQLGFRKGTHC